jgi:hypothetical protein
MIVVGLTPASLASCFIVVMLEVYNDNQDISDADLDRKAYYNSFSLRDSLSSNSQGGLLVFRHESRIQLYASQRSMGLTVFGVIGRINNQLPSVPGFPQFFPAQWRKTRSVLLQRFVPL